MKKLALLILVYSLSIFASNAKIKEIKAKFYKIEKEIKQGSLKDTKTIENEDYGINTTIFRKNGKIVKLKCEGGTGDSYHSGEYYYRKDGTLFFSYISANSVHGCSSQKRSYFNKQGKLILQKNKNGKCEYNIYFPKKVTNPKKFYSNFCQK